MGSLFQLCLSAAFAITLVCPALAFPPQTPLRAQHAKSSKLINQLKHASVIPDVLDSFKPKVTLSLFWENATAEVGNTIDPGRLQQAPDAQFINHVPSLISFAPTSSSPNEEKQRLQKMQLTLAMTDPDAPSRDDPKWSEICHWIATNIQITDPEDLHSDAVSVRDGFSRDPETIMPYKGPAPPAGTGKHRYVFAALAPKNGTTERLFLSKPEDRKKWGYGASKEDVRVGLRHWATEMGLEVIGANFIYAQHKEQ